MVFMKLRLLKEISSIEMPYNLNFLPELQYEGGRYMAGKPAPGSTGRVGNADTVIRNSIR